MSLSHLPDYLRGMRFLLSFFLVPFFMASTHSASIQTVCGTGVAGYGGDGSQAISAQVRNPYGVCVGPDGALYFCDMDNHAVRRVQNGTVTTVAGSGRRGYSGNNGPAVQAEMNEPYEVRFDWRGAMYVVEMRNHVVRRISTNGIISLVAGSGKAGFAGDGGPAQNAELNQPHSVQLDGAGNLFICDIGNHRIRRVDARTGFISTYAGTGEKRKPRDGANIAGEPLFGPRALDFDRHGDIWLALREGNAIYRIETKTGVLHHMAGAEGKGPPAGLAKEVALSGPKGISVAPNGAVYFADTESHTIKRLQNGRVEIVAGDGERGDGPDGDPLRCRLARPHGICVDGQGVVYVGDSENNRVRMLR